MKYTKNSIKENIAALGIDPTGTLLVHSSMKAIGEVEGGADSVLDAFIEYMEPGLLIFPSHTWKEINHANPVFDPAVDHSCVGLLSDLFWQRKEAVRSWHPTHSVAAIGKDAFSYTSGEEKTNTPCPREGCWGKLVDRKAKILFLGCTLKSNTFLHGVEEWNAIPDRLAGELEPLKIKIPGGEVLDCPQHRHSCSRAEISENYDKMEKPFLENNIAKIGRIGDAKCYICDAAGMYELTSRYLKINQDLFINDKPIDFMSDLR